MTVEAQLGVVRKVAAELEEERAEVFVDTVEVILVDHGRGLDDPGVLLARVRVGAFLGAEDRHLFLGFADEQHSLAAGKSRPIVGGDIIFALILVEGKQRDVVRLGEGFDVLDEGGADRGKVRYATQMAVA